MLEHFETGAEKTVFLSLLALTALATCVSLASVQNQVGRPWPGFVVWSNLVVPAIGTLDWPGQRAGVPLRSVVTAADGHPLDDAAALRAYVRERPRGARVSYTFRRGDESFEVAVPITLFRWRDLLAAYAGYLIDGLAFLATGLLVFYLKPRLPAARATLALGMVLGMSLILALDLFSAYWLERVYFLFESLMPAALLHVALCFPEEKDLVRRHPSLRWIVYVPFLFFAVAQNALLDSHPEAHLRVNDWVYTATAATGLLAFGSLVQSFFAARTPRARQQAKVVFAAAAGAAFVPSLGLLSMTVIGIPFPMNFLSPFFLLFPLSMAYAIARHDLFSVDRYLRLGVVYGALSLMIVVSYGVMVTLAGSWVGGDRPLPRALVPLFLFAVVVLLDPLRSRVQSIVDRLFFRQAYTYRTTVETTSRALSSVLDTEVIARTLLGTLTEAMAIDGAVLLLRDVSANAPRGYARPPDRLAPVLQMFPAGDERLAGLRRWLGPLLREEESPPSADGVDLEGLRRLGIDLVLPLRFRDHVVGTVLIGPKQSGAYFSYEDLHLLGTLMNQTALALTNARAYEIIRDTQAELVRSERMAAVGELAAAVAHGIRNPLAGIRGTAQVAREDAEDDPRLARDLDNILSEADRLERRVRSILDLTGPLESHLQPGDLSSFLTAFVAAMRSRVPPGIELELDAGPGLPPVPFDSARLNEVIETIIVNAVEALGGFGRISITARAEIRRDGCDVVVSVADNGPGIPEAALDHVFDLFYTTKKSGTGMGLAIAKRLVERQGGRIEVRNAPAGGAIVSIRFAAAPEVTARSA